MTTHDNKDLAALQSKLYESQAHARSLQIQLDYARAELADARRELNGYAPVRLETV
jgi:hypothetical protein